MGCRLYFAESAAGDTLRGHRGHAEERHSWRKGGQVMNCQALCNAIFNFFSVTYSRPWSVIMRSPCRVNRADCSDYQWGVRADRANIHPDT